MNKPTPTLYAPRRPLGFTLIELLVCAAIASVLITVAIPSYLSYLKRVERSDARASLLRLGADQQSFFIRNGRYAADLKELGFKNAAALSADRHYRLSIISSDTEGFVVRAVRVASDTENTLCHWFELDQKQARSSGPADIQECWMR